MCILARIVWGKYYLTNQSCQPGNIMAAYTQMCSTPLMQVKINMLVFFSTHTNMCHPPAHRVSAPLQARQMMLATVVFTLTILMQSVCIILKLHLFTQNV